MYFLSKILLKIHLGELTHVHQSEGRLPACPDVGSPDDLMLTLETVLHLVLYHPGECRHKYGGLV
jgi:hypothetical protein